MELVKGIWEWLCYKVRKAKAKPMRWLAYLIQAKITAWKTKDEYHDQKKYYGTKDD
uniref:Uncharacterized protein n=1 Tax=viral metagenome TaxID=1070528 RepID=A0A6H1ZAR2_9ZZZZ